MVTRKKKGFMLLCALVLVLFAMPTYTRAYTEISVGNFSEQAITIDFEEYPVGSNITTQYAGLGVLFSSYHGTGVPQIDWNELGDGQGLNGGPGDPAIYTANCQDAGLWVHFIDPSTGNPGVTSAGGAYYVDMETYIGRGFFYDVDDNLIHTFVLDQDWDFWGLRADPGDDLIGSILFDSTGYDGGFGPDVSESYTIDNLIFEHVVPEPATVFLLGLGGVALLRKRRVVNRREH